MLFRRLIVVSVHVCVWTVSLVGALLLRHEFAVPPATWRRLMLWLPALLAIRVVTFQLMGLFRGLWRYTGTHDAWKLFRAQSVSTLLFAAFLVFTSTQSFPRSAIVIEWFLALVAVGGLRLTARMLRRGITLTHEGARRLLIVGAGDGGEMLLREIQRNTLHRHQPVGFVDDDRRKQGEQIHGVPVLGTIDQVATLAQEHDIQEIIVAIPTADGAAMRRILDLCKPAGVPTLTIPSLDGLVDGRVTVNQVRDIEIEDLLGREPVNLDTGSISQALSGRTVLVTGAGGSIGSEICRQVCRIAPAKLILVERAENSLFYIHRELEARFPGLELVPCIADILDERRLTEVFEKHRPDVVFHAAAHKHVPMMEWNPGEAVKNNVLGTKTLADVADRFEVERFVMISTDKAVRPASVMGVSKRTAEIYVQTLSQRSRTRFVTVRFGNVLGSAGSVIPIFREQIKAGGPVTVTHPEMRRYFMTIPEASQLVLQAGAMGEGGEIFILDMGEPVRIVDIARDLITLSGLRPDVDIRIEFTGVRPGEKMSEDLATDTENATRTGHPKIFVGTRRPHRWDQVCRKLDELGELADGSADAIRAKFAEIVPDYQDGKQTPVPHLPADGWKQLGFEVTAKALPTQGSVARKLEVN